MDSFAFIYLNKVYDEEIIFEATLDILEEFNIKILNSKGELYKLKDNHILEFLIELI